MKIEQPKIKFLNDEKLDNCEYLITGNFKDEKLARESFGFVEFKECCLTRITMNDLNLSKTSCVDVIFENCDLSNSNLENTFFNRVILRDCSLIGVSIINTSLNDVIFENCKLDYANFSGSKFNKVKFTESKLISSSFNTVMFKNTFFENSNLIKSEFIATSLSDIDFSTDDISGISVTPSCLNNCTVSLFQAVDLTKVLGLKIKDG